MVVNKVYNKVGDNNMNKLFTIAVVAMISLFLTTSVVAQGKQDRRHKGAEHSKKAKVEKSSAKCGVEACKCACHKSAKVKAGPHRERRGDARRSRGGNRGRGAGTGRGSRRWDRGGNRGRGSERMEELLKRFREHRSEAGGRA